MPKNNKSNSKSKKDSDLSNDEIILTSQEVTDMMKRRSEEIMQNFNAYLNSIAVNSINIDFIKKIEHRGKAFRGYLQEGSMILIPGRNEVKLSSTNESITQKNIFDAAHKADPLVYDVRNQQDLVIISLKPVTKERREKISIEIQQIYEDYKKKINIIRQDAIKSTRSMSEDNKKRCEKEIEKIKDDYMHNLAKHMDNKVRSISS